MMELIYIIFVGLLGLSFGSFLNVVAYRLPLLIKQDFADSCESLFDNFKAPKPTYKFSSLASRSHCPNCNTLINFRDNIPVISYFLLKGKCRECKSHISKRYPIVEIICCLLTIYTWITFGYSWQTPAVALLIFGLIVLTLVDIDTMTLPDEITLPFLWIGLLSNNFFSILTDGNSAILGATFGYLSLFSIFWVFKIITKKDGMGYGDFKLLAMLGAWLGWQLLPLIIMLSSLLGAVIGIIAIWINKKTKTTPIPFGPFLAIAGIIALFYGKEINFWYLNFIGL